LARKTSRKKIRRKNPQKPVHIDKSKEEEDKSLAAEIRRVIKFHRQATEKRASTATKKKGKAPLSETLRGKAPQVPDKVQEKMTPEDCCAILSSMAEHDPDRFITRNYFRLWSGIKESTWNHHFGTFSEFKKQAGVTLARGPSRMERHLAKHASSDTYRAISEERRNYGEKYLKDRPGDFKTILAFTDVHDIDCDPFALRVLLDTAKTAAGVIDTVVIGGDLFDLPEFSRWTQDPREWDVVGRIGFIHENILRPLREILGDKVQIDVLEGNHEARLLRHMADATPALKAVLSDLHGMTVSKLFGLDEFEVNYVAQCDLSALSWRKTDHNKELARNWKVYHDCVLSHHFTSYGKKKGMPGFSGHHHRHQVWTNDSPVFGPFEWHQFGAMHVRQASYTDGEAWNNGFSLIHVHKPSKSVQFEYTTVGQEFAVSAGKFYTRGPKENLLVS